MTMQTRDEFMKETKEELGEKVFSDLYVGIDNEYYEMVESQVKQGEAISQKVYDSLTEGQRYHFTKHYNHRGNMVF
jgi:hypothetical protein